ncbi:hypothetical protein F4604DRAFT_1935791 [Suillus subluteus]|nr:hypothetical protein F4604DRAFT_1935791 [Suillus subluteus]
MRSTTSLFPSFPSFLSLSFPSLLLLLLPLNNFRIFYYLLRIFDYLVSSILLLLFLILLILLILLSLPLSLSLTLSFLPSFLSSSLPDPFLFLGLFPPPPPPPSFSACSSSAFLTICPAFLTLLSSSPLLEYLV